MLIIIVLHFTICFPNVIFYSQKFQTANLKLKTICSKDFDIIILIKICNTKENIL